jgi:hypothetical protein
MSYVSVTPWFEGEGDCRAVSSVSLRRKEITWLVKFLDVFGLRKGNGITRITPILFGEFEDLTLACKKCGSTKELRINRS